MAAILKLINYIFSETPKPPCTFKFPLQNLNHTEKNKLLWNILVVGAKKIYGDSISVNTIEPHQFFKLDQYIQSIGYKLRYQSCPDGTLIWFDKLTVLNLCNGTKIIKIN